MTEHTYPQSEKNKKGYLAAIGSAFFLSLTSIFIRHLTDVYGLPALVLVYWREIFVALSVAIILAVVNPNRLRGIKGHYGFLLLYGLVVALFNSMWTFSVAQNGAAVATVLAYSSTAFTTLLGWLLLKESISYIKIVVVVMSLVGCALVVGAYSPELWALNGAGALVGMAVGLSYSFYGIMGRIGAKRGLNTWTMLLYIFLFGSFMVLVVNLAFGYALPGGARKPVDMFWLGTSLPGWLMMIALAVGPTLFGFGLYNVSLRYLPSSTANLVVMIEPIFTSIVAYFIFGEVLSFIQLVGALLILSAMLVLRLDK